MEKKEFIKHLNFISAELQHKCEDNEVMRAEIEEYFNDYIERVKNAS